MAHSCPDCGSACYCGDDIDDVELEDDDATENCTCCLGKDDDNEDEGYLNSPTCFGCGAHPEDGEEHEDECPESADAR
jgi:hypothetical protein